MGDLQGEFSSAPAPDKGEELPLEELGTAFGSGHSGSLGKYSTGLMSHAIGGFNISSAKTHLSKTWGLGSQHADAVLLVATTMEPAKCLASEAEGKTWLDAAAQVYAQRVGISLSTGGGVGSTGGSSGGAVMVSEEFLKFQASCEHVDAYIDGIQPVFDALKARHFDSSWNWVRQDALLMF